MTGVGPAFLAWEASVIAVIRHPPRQRQAGEADVLPLNYIRKCLELYMMKFKQSIYVIIIFFLFILPLTVTAEENSFSELEAYSVNFDQGLIAKGYTIASPDNDFRLGVFPYVLSEATEFVLKKRTEVDHPLPKNKEKLSDYWEFDIINKNSYDSQKPIIVQMEYQESINLKGVYFWNGHDWQELPSKIINPQKRIIRAFFHLPYARFLVLGDQEVMSEGLASWYRYQGCNCAASPDYPKETILKVINLDNNKSVQVRVNDWGPDRSVHPERVIDLDLVAFQQIANKWNGLARVMVEPIDIH